MNKMAKRKTRRRRLSPAEKYHRSGVRGASRVARFSLSPTDLALGYAGGLAEQFLKEPKVRREIRKWERMFGL